MAAKCCSWDADFERPTKDFMHKMSYEDDTMSSTVDTEPISYIAITCHMLRVIAHLPTPFRALLGIGLDSKSIEGLTEHDGESKATKRTALISQKGRAPNHLRCFATRLLEQRLCFLLL